MDVNTLRQYPTIIVDDAHLLKDYTTQRVEVLGKAVTAARRAILVTGLPALTRPNDIFCQARRFPSHVPQVIAVPQTTIESSAVYE